MIDVGSKQPTSRKAIAEGRISLSKSLIEKIKKRTIPKGDVLKTAEIAGLLAIKNTPHVIPHCHVVKITGGKIDFNINRESVTVRSEVTGIDRTGFEMEALYGVAVALLTIYDMCKFSGLQMELNRIHLVEKTGGKKQWRRKRGGSTR